MSDNENILLNEKYTAQEKFDLGMEVDAYHAAICSGFPVSAWKEQFKCKKASVLQTIPVTREKVDEVVRAIITKRKHNAINLDSI